MGLWNTYHCTGTSRIRPAFLANSNCTERGPTLCCWERTWVKGSKSLALEPDSLFSIGGLGSGGCSFFWGTRTVLCTLYFVLRFWGAGPVFWSNPLVTKGTGLLFRGLCLHSAGVGVLYEFRELDFWVTVPVFCGTRSGFWETGLQV